MLTKSVGTRSPMLTVRARIWLSLDQLEYPARNDSQARFPREQNWRRLPLLVAIYRTTALEAANFPGSVDQPETPRQGNSAAEPLTRESHPFIPKSLGPINHWDVAAGSGRSGSSNLAKRAGHQRNPFDFPTVVIVGRNRDIRSPSDSIFSDKRLRNRVGAKNSRIVRSRVVHERFIRREPPQINSYLH